MMPRRFHLSQYIRNSKFWDLDPGYLHLQQALKTVLSILCMLGLLHREPLLIKLMVGVIIGFSMQGATAKTFRRRVWQIISLNIGYFVAFIVGLSVHASPVGSALVLSGMGFMVNYLRRFGLQTSSAPFMSWCLCFFATILPFPDLNEIWHHVPILLLALFITGLVNLFILPKNYSRLFISNSNRLLAMLAQAFDTIQRYTVHPLSERYFQRLSFVKMADRLLRLLAYNQAIVQDMANETMSEQILEQYALVHAYTLLLDAYRILVQHQHQLPASLSAKLKLIYASYKQIFVQLRMNENYEVKSQKSVQLPDLTPLLYQLPTLEPRMVLVLLNLKLSFNLLNREITTLLRITDEIEVYH